LTRSIANLTPSVFASWDAEEYALVGSTEWVEDHIPWLSSTAISYLNLDIAVAGPLPGAASTPELRTLAMGCALPIPARGQRLHRHGLWE
jgi:hypothetical protein